MDRDLEAVLQAIFKADPNNDLSDENREKLVYATIGNIADDDYRAVWQFSKTIKDDFKRPYVQLWLSRKLASRFPFRLAEEIARSIELPYYKWSALAEVASEKLKWKRSLPRGAAAPDFSEEAFRLIHEVQDHIPEVPDEDRSTIVWKLGHILIDAGRLEWAEQVAAIDEYDPDHTNVLLAIAKARAKQGEADRVVALAEKVAQLARNANNWHEHPAFDLESVGGLFLELGNKPAAIACLEGARVRAVAEQARGNIEAPKCLIGIAENFAKAGDIQVAVTVANEIKPEHHRDRALKLIGQASLEHG